MCSWLSCFPFNKLWRSPYHTSTGTCKKEAETMKWHSYTLGKRRPLAQLRCWCCLSGGCSHWFQAECLLARTTCFLSTLQWVLVNHVPIVTRPSKFHELKASHSYPPNVLFIGVRVQFAVNSSSANRKKQKLFIANPEKAYVSTSDKKGLINVIALQPRWEWELTNLLDCSDGNQ